MLRLVAATFVFLGGFAIMVLEIIGVRYLAKDFGSTSYVWISQIGVILAALAIGYAIGGALADRFRRAAFLAVPLAIAGLFILFTPDFTPRLIEAIIMRHPLDRDIPAIWQKLDPVLGSTVVFFLPCCLLAIISPYMIRVTARQVEHVGTISGLIYAASTVGSIGGVFVSGYYLIDILDVPEIIRATGILVLLLAGVSLIIDWWIRQSAGLTPEIRPAQPS